MEARARSHLTRVARSCPVLHNRNTFSPEIRDRFISTLETEQRSFISSKRDNAIVPSRDEGTSVEEQTSLRAC